MGIGQVKPTRRSSDPQPRPVFLSDTGKRQVHSAGDTIGIPAQGVVTLRAEFAKP